ncbi:CCAAT/enhancer-binding protein epsilon [Triplophysa tibetana]|uniref:CCAAT/enhancer-binding protein epsilon n=1 Tax=Triplophysa tibetana TaxID=1572043 RepID=A0A5A9N515_9TELE|nr:CCAAT/enhancer-binding protein epsilon [Triplophysa tibetana]
MSISDSPSSSSCIFTPQNPACTSSVGTLSLNSDSSGPPLNAMANQMDGGFYGQSMGPQGLPKFPDPRNMEQMMGLGYLPFSSCLTSTNTEQAGQQGHIAQQDFSQFLLPPPAATLRQSGQKRGIRKDSIEYRLRRERNNIAVRKSRDKARRRIHLTQQRALQLQDENHRLQLHIQRLSHEVETLKHYLSQRHLQVKEQDMRGEDNC